MLYVGVNIIIYKNFKKQILCITITLTFALILCGTSSADSYVGGQPLTTVQNGTVNGGVYDNSYYGFNETANVTGNNNMGKANITYNFTPLPADANVTNATLYVEVYCGDMNANNPVNVNVTFNGIQIEKTMDMSTIYNNAYSGGNNNVAYGGTVSDPYLIVNNNTIRVGSDYWMSFNVADLMKQHNTAWVSTIGSEDGRIKLITLIAPFNISGSNSKLEYWINEGQDECSYNDEDYSGSTTFSGLPADYTVNDAELNVLYMDSEGVYYFNSPDNILPSGIPLGSYSGIDTWNVTSDYDSQGGSNTLFYHLGTGTGTGGYYKIALAILTVDYTPPTVNLPELEVTNITCNPNAGALAGNLFNDENNTVQVGLINIGSAAAGSFKVLLTDGKNTATQVVHGLASEASTIINFTNYTTSVNGYTRLSVIADSGQQLNQESTADSQFNQTVQVIRSKLPDLVPTNINITSTVNVNETYPVTVTINNEGNLNSNATEVSLVATDGSGNESQIGAVSLNALPINGTATVNFRWTPTEFTEYTLTAIVDPQNLMNELDKELDEDNNIANATVIAKNPNIINMFIISDDTGTNLLVSAADQLLEQSGLKGKVDIQIRTSDQVSAMSENELTAYLASCDIFIGDWLTEGAYQALQQIITTDPAIADKKLFLVLEPPISDTPAAASLFYYTNINGKPLLNNYTTQQLEDYYTNTMRGNTYDDVVTYLQTCDFPSILNQGELYKDEQDVTGEENLILWTLNLTGFKTTYSNPPDTLSEPTYGIYRNQWFSYLTANGTWESGLATYEKEYFKPGEPTVGLIESTMYVQAEELEPYNALIETLESDGLNVIPVVAFGATEDQLTVMLDTFTNATNCTDFVNDPSAYKINVNAVVCMLAYGLGGDEFDNVTQFFTALDVPVFSAMHSDYETNAQYELSANGLGVTDGEKWWHIAILEAQGVVDPIFIGGMDETIDPLTGGSVSGYVPYTPNINLVCKTVAAWVQLKYLSNSSKKIAMIYYDYPPGRQGISASYLDPIQSIENLLNILLENGYDVTDIPANSQELLNEMLAQGTNIANWASGLVDNLADNDDSLYDEMEAFQASDTDQDEFSGLNSTEIQVLKDMPGVILWPVTEFEQWFDNLSQMDQFDVEYGPIAYMRAECQEALGLNGPDLTNSTGMVGNIETWESQIMALIPANQTAAATPILTDICNALTSYIITGKSVYWNEFLSYEKMWNIADFSGMMGWGPFPGNIMTVDKNGTEYFVLPAIQFGNVLIGPEPQRGWEGNSELLYHNSVVPPDYQYLAFYAYLQTQGYDAMVFIGRHGTHEWLPGKEVLNDASNWPNIITDGIPQIYFYIVDGIAEGVQAQRRGSAVIIDHMTPPMGLTQLYGGLSDLEKFTDDYDGIISTGTAAQLEEDINLIKQCITTNNLQGALGIDNLNSISNQDLLNACNNYLDLVVNSFYPDGNDILGQNWTVNETALLASSMLSVAQQIPGGTSTTSLNNEVSLISYNEPSSSLNAGEQNAVQTECINIVTDLIQDNENVTAIAYQLTSDPSSNLLFELDTAVEYIKNIEQSPDDEITSFLNALDDGYIPPGTGDDPINNPAALPTGNDFYQNEATETPTQLAYADATQLTLTTLESLNNTTEKIAVGLWAEETARDNGELLSMILDLLGVEPTWSSSPSAGSEGEIVNAMPTLVPLDQLVRPAGWADKRIDVVVVIDGTMRDQYSQQLALLDNAFKEALAASYYTIIDNNTLKSKYGSKLTTGMNYVMSEIGYYGIGNEPLDDNYVALDWVNDFCIYMSQGMDSTEAATLAITRIFGPPNGDYGANLASEVRQSWTWNTTTELADAYLARIGHMYSNTDWGTEDTEAFTEELTGVSAIDTSRDTNLYGVLDNDDFYDYWGGLAMTVDMVNNDTVPMDVLKYGTGEVPQAVTFNQYLNLELDTRYFNPQYIEGMMGDGYEGAFDLQQGITNLFGWQVTQPQSVTQGMWNNVVSTYLNDQYNTGVTKFLESGDNSYAMISTTGTILTAAWKGYYTPSKSTLQQVANTWAQMVIEHGVACCDCSCGNIAMMTWSMQYINPNMLAQLKKQLYAATQNAAFAPSSASNSNAGQSSSQSSSSSQSQSSSQSSSSSQSQSSQGQSQGSSPGTSGAELTVAATSQSGSTGQTGGSQSQAHEINKVNQQNPSTSSQNTGMPIEATIAVIVIICLIGFGYFKGRIN